MCYNLHPSVEIPKEKAVKLLKDRLHVLDLIKRKAERVDPNSDIPLWALGQIEGVQQFLSSIPETSGYLSIPVELILLTDLAPVILPLA